MCLQYKSFENIVGKGEIARKNCLLGNVKTPGSSLTGPFQFFSGSARWQDTSEL